MTTFPEQKLTSTLSYEERLCKSSSLGKGILPAYTGFTMLRLFLTLVLSGTLLLQ